MRSTRMWAVASPNAAMPQARGRSPRRKRGSAWPTPAITALPILAVAPFVLFVVL
jgi:hypothetical protein